MGMVTLINGVPVAGDGFIADGSLSLSKLAALTASKAVATDSSGLLSASAATAAALAFLDATSSVQTQLNTKLTTGGGALVNADVNASAAIALSKLAALTASRVPVTDGSGVLSASAVTAATLAFLDATSSIQTQLGARPVVLASYSPSAAASVDITSQISGTYENYAIYFRLAPATDDVSLRIRTSTDNGSTYSTAGTDYNTAGIGFDENFQQTPFIGNATSVVIGDTSPGLSVGNAAGEHISGLILFHRGSASLFPQFLWMAGWREATPSGGSGQYISVGSGNRASTAAVNAVRLLFTTGNITSGLVKFIGLA